MSNIYAIGIGGSGSKCIESLVFLHSLGLFGKVRLGVLIVDADTGNGNTDRAGVNLQRSVTCQQLLGEGKTPLFSGEFKFYGIWNPLTESQQNLDRIFNRQAMSAIAPNLEYLYDALYSPEERQVLLDVGFRGRPLIGSAVMSKLDASNPDVGNDNEWQRLLYDLEADANLSAKDAPTVHLFGSIFGGTGASGVPTIGNLINQKIKEKGIRHRVHLNATPLLPYFGFNKPNDDQQIYAETKSFELNTQAALQYFNDHSKGIFDTIYLVGSKNQAPYSPSTGGTQQRNDAHFVELFAALSTAHGTQQPIQSQAASKTQVAYISCNSEKTITWSDLPTNNSEINVRQLMQQGVRLTYSWLFNFSLELKDARDVGAKKFVKGAPWFFNFYAPGRSKPSVADELERSKEKAMDEWAESFLIWAKQISSSNQNEGPILFTLKDVKITDPKQRTYREELGRIVIDGSNSDLERKNDTISRLKDTISSQPNIQQNGLHSLIHALFDVCR